MNSTGPDDSSHRHSRADWALVAALGIALAGLTVVGADDYRRYETGKSRQRLEAGIQAGESVPPLAAERIGGGPQLIDYRAQSADTTIYVTRTGCQWSERNLANFQHVVATTTRKIVVLSLDDDEATARELTVHMNVNVPMYFRPTKEAVRAYGLTATPITISVSPRGIVQTVLRGAYLTTALHREAEKYFGVTLPAPRAAE